MAFRVNFNALAQAINYSAKIVKILAKKNCVFGHVSACGWID